MITPRIVDSSLAEAAAEQASLVFRLRFVLLSYLWRAGRQQAFVGQTYHEPYLFVAAHVLHVDGYSYLYLYLSHDVVCC